MKNTPLKRKKGLRKVSLKQAGRLVRYYRIRNEFMADHPWCQVCQEMGKEVQIATDCHHRKGRRGSLLFDTKYFMAVCRNCHDLRIHGDVKNAQKRGWLIPFWK